MNPTAKIFLASDHGVCPKRLEISCVDHAVVFFNRSAAVIAPPNPSTKPVNDVSKIFRNRECADSFVVAWLGRLFPNKMYAKLSDAHADHLLVAEQVFRRYRNIPHFVKFLAINEPCSLSLEPN